MKQTAAQLPQMTFELTGVVAWKHKSKNLIGSRKIQSSKSTIVWNTGKNLILKKTCGLTWLPHEKKINLFFFFFFFFFFFEYTECLHQLSKCKQKSCNMNHCWGDLNTGWSIISHMNNNVRFSTYTNWLTQYIIWSFVI